MWSFQLCESAIPLLSVAFHHISCISYHLLPGGSSFAKELHETALHHEPEASRHVEYDSQEDEVQGDPLIVGVVHNCVIAVVLK